MIQGYHAKFQLYDISTSLEFSPHLAFFYVLLMVSCFRLDCIKSAAMLFYVFLTVWNGKAFFTAWTMSSLEDL